MITSRYIAKDMDWQRRNEDHQGETQDSMDGQAHKYINSGRAWHPQ